MNNYLLPARKISTGEIEKNSAFTLAEVLITLLVVGVVAAMTLPTLNRQIQRKILYSQFMKAVSVLNQAAKMYQADSGCDNLYYCWSEADKDFSVNFSKHFSGATLINDENAVRFVRGMTG